MDSVADSDSSSREMLSCDLTLDIISNLPSNIQDNILICLPIRDAARTTALSKKWRFIWHYISQIVYDENCSNGRDQMALAEDRLSLFPSLRDFGVLICRNEIALQIYQILLLHRGRLRKFVLSLESAEIQACVVNQLIFFLTEKDIQEFTLRLPSKLNYRLPSLLFQCVHLTHLNISGCVVPVPPRFTGLKRLNKLELHLDHLDAVDLKTFLSNCPLVQQLHLQIRGKGNPLEIDAAQLKFLSFSCGSRSIVFKNVPLLSKVIILQSSGELLGKSYGIAEMFGSLPAIEYFHADNEFLMCFCAGVIPERLPGLLYRLKYVKISEFRFSSLKAVQSALLLIISSPNLQNLTIKSHAESSDGQDNYQVLKAFSVIEDDFNQLQEVTMEDFIGTVAELEFLKILLSKSIVLKRITIQPPTGISDTKKLKIVKDVIRFQMVSSKAEIIF